MHGPEVSHPTPLLVMCGDGLRRGGWLRSDSASEWLIPSSLHKEGPPATLAESSNPSAVGETGENHAIQSDSLTLLSLPPPLEHPRLRRSLPGSLEWSPGPRHWCHFPNQPEGVNMSAAGRLRLCNYSIASNQTTQRRPLCKGNIIQNAAESVLAQLAKQVSGRNIFFCLRACTSTSGKQPVGIGQGMTFLPCMGRTRSHLAGRLNGLKHIGVVAAVVP